MNDFYLYQYSDGKQFLSTGDPVLIRVFAEKDSSLIKEVPKVLGRWRFKTIKKNYANGK